MEISQEIVDVYVSGATDNGMKNWTGHDFRHGVQAVLNYLDPVPSDVKAIRDSSGQPWYRTEADPMIWYDNNRLHRTARQITIEFGEISWEIGK